MVEPAVFMGGSKDVVVSELGRLADNHAPGGEAAGADLWDSLDHDVDLGHNIDLNLSN